MLCWGWCCEADDLFSLMIRYLSNSCGFKSVEFKSYKFAHILLHISWLCLENGINETARRLRLVVLKCWIHFHHFLKWPHQFDSFLIQNTVWVEGRDCWRKSTDGCCAVCCAIWCAPKVGNGPAAVPDWRWFCDWQPRKAGSSIPCNGNNPTYELPRTHISNHGCTLLHHAIFLFLQLLYTVNSGTTRRRCWNCTREAWLN